MKSRPTFRITRYSVEIKRAREDALKIQRNLEEQLNEEQANIQDNQVWCREEALKIQRNLEEQLNEEQANIQDNQV